MKPDLILRSDMLDILFEHRNKDYGAYALRRGYQNRLLKGIGGMVALSVGLWMATQFRNNNSGNENGLPIIFVSDTITLQPPPVTPPEPVTPPPPQRKVATADFVTPILDPLVEHSESPEMEEMVEKAIGKETIEGEPENGEPPAPAANASPAPAAPIPPAEEVEPEVLPSAAVMPQFPGGDAALQRWLSRQLRPQEDQQPGQRIKVIVRFVVNKTGEIDRISLVQPGGDPFDQEVLRVIHKMPRWEAGQQNGKKVAVWFNIPIIFETTEQ